MKKLFLTLFILLCFTGTIVWAEGNITASTITAKNILGQTDIIKITIKLKADDKGVFPSAILNKLTSASIKQSSLYSIGFYSEIIAPSDGTKLKLLDGKINIIGGDGLVYSTAKEALLMFNMADIQIIENIMAVVTDNTESNADLTWVIKLKMKNTPY